MARRRYYTPEPGTREAADQIAAESGNPGLPDRYTNEGIEEFNEGKDEPSGVYVIASDFERDLEARASLRKIGAQAPSPQDEIAAPYVEANPDRAFRWLSRQHCEKRGTRGYQPVIDPKTRKKVTHLNEERWLGHLPKDVRDARLAGYREQSERARRAAREQALESGKRAERDSDGAIRVIPEDQMIRLAEGRRR